MVIYPRKYHTYMQEADNRKKKPLSEVLEQGQSMFGHCFRVVMRGLEAR